MRAVSSPVFIFICCVLLTLPFLLAVAAGAENSGQLSISGRIPLAMYDIAVTGSGSGWTTVVVTWKTNDDANSTVQYGLTNKFGLSRSDAVMTRNHRITLSGLQPGRIYHYQVQSQDTSGNDAVSSQLTFKTADLPTPTPVPTTVPTAVPTSIPTTSATTSIPGNDGGGGGGMPAAPAVNPQAAMPQVVSPQLAPPQLAPPEQLSAPVSESYPVGFDRMSFNADGLGILSIDLDAAQNAGATVTLYSDRVDVYQHHSPGVTLIFHGDHFTVISRHVTGNVSYAEFITDPVCSTVNIGNISGSVHALLPSLTRGGLVNATLSESITADTWDQFSGLATASGLTLGDVAYTLDVQTADIAARPANVTLSVPSSWVNRRGGISAVHITRISRESGQAELLGTTYLGSDTSGNLIFRGDSPNGTSLFGLVTAETKSSGLMIPTNVTPAPSVGLSRFPVLGILGQFPESLLATPLLLIPVVVFIVVLGYFLWLRYRKTEK